MSSIVSMGANEHVIDHNIDTVSLKPPAPRVHLAQLHGLGARICKILRNITLRSDMSIQAKFYNGDMLHTSKQRHSVASSLTTHRRKSCRDETINSILENGFPYSSKLSAHTSCVNALAFSSGEGRFMASGGDDFQTCIWDFHQEDVTTPIYSLRGPRGNIFTLAFSATNRYLYSGGTDETILKYDVSTLGMRANSRTSQRPDETFRTHDDTIRAISCHPYQEEVILSAGQDGRILLHDGRANALSRAQSTLALTTEATGVRHHPNMEYIFATSDSHGEVCLRDSRMAFGPRSSRDRDGVALRYLTKLTRKGHDKLGRAEVSSITFNSDGSKLAAVMLHFYPTIYGISDPNPLAICSGKNHPDGTPVLSQERTYSNSCTIKSTSFGNFGLDSGDFFSAGSEDFRGYLWKVPSVAQLMDQRVELSGEDWMTQDWPHITAFTNGHDGLRYIPVDLSTPHCYLHGHQSIVNSTLLHPHLLHAVTSGIERDIILHSPTLSSPCAPNLQQTSTDVRNLEQDGREDRAVYFRVLAGIEAHPDDDSESTAIRMFDHILREEGNTDVFDVRGRAGEDESSSDETFEDDQEDDDSMWL